MTLEPCIVVRPDLSSISGACCGHVVCGGDGLRPRICHSFLVCVPMLFSLGPTYMFTCGLKPPFLLHSACRTCGVCLESPRLLSGQPLRPVRNAPSCVLTRAAIRDILSCLTYRCTAGSTLVSVSTAQPWFPWPLGRGGSGALAPGSHTAKDTGVSRDGKQAFL